MKRDRELSQIANSALLLKSSLLRNMYMLMYIKNALCSASSVLGLTGNLKAYSDNDFNRYLTTTSLLLNTIEALSSCNSDSYVYDLQSLLVYSEEIQALVEEYISSLRNDETADVYWLMKLLTECKKKTVEDCLHIGCEDRESEINDFEFAASIDRAISSLNTRLLLSLKIRITFSKAFLFKSSEILAGQVNQLLSIANYTSLNNPHPMSSYMTMIWLAEFIYDMAQEMDFFSPIDIEEFSIRVRLELYKIHKLCKDLDTAFLTESLELCLNHSRVTSEIELLFSTDSVVTI